MRRKQLFRCLASSSSSAILSDLVRHTVALEPLEDRLLLTSASVYVNDDWINDDGGDGLQIGDVVHSVAADGIAIYALYGVDAFGLVDGAGLGGASRIYDAIQATPAGGTLNLLGGTYTESDIVIDRPMVFQGQGASGATVSLIRPEVSSADSQEDFGVGTRSGIILYSPSVVVSDLRIDGSANPLVGSQEFHHGITTLYDNQNGGDYASLRNGPLPLIVLGMSGGGANNSTPDIDINDVAVDNVYWHGVTISPLHDRAFDTGYGGNSNLQVRNSSISNVGDFKDQHRIGVLLQNLVDEKESIGNASNLTITDVGVGVKTAPYGTNPIFASNDAATNQSYVQYVDVVDPVVYGFDINFANRNEAYGWHVTVNDPVNDVVGILLNATRSSLVGAQVTGAKIGVEIHNSPSSMATSSANLNSGLAWSTSLTGPGVGTPYSVGVLIDSQVDDQYGSDVFFGPDSQISGYDIGIKVQQTAQPFSIIKNTAILFGTRITGNSVGVVAGDRGVVTGSLDTAQSVYVTGSGVISPRMDNWNPVSPYYYDNPANSGANRIASGPNAERQYSGNLTLGSNSTFEALLTGDTGGSTLFNFNNPATYNFAAPPPDPIDGVVPQPYGALFDWFGKVFQSGVADGDGNKTLSVQNVVNGQYDFLFGSNNVPITSGPNSGNYQLVGTDIHNSSHISLKVKLRPENVSSMFAFGLLDYRGNVNAWTVDTTRLSSLTYTTLTFNLLTPAVSLTGPDGHFDLSNVAGWVFGGDQGVANQLHTVPIGFDVDEVSVFSVLNSGIKVTGTVNLGGAALQIDPQGFLPTFGQEFTLIQNDGADPVIGTFSNVPQGYLVNYAGGDGNDVVLTTTVFEQPPLRHHIFYNQSAFDGNNAAIDPVHDAMAIATDKTAYLPGSGTASFNNITSYSRGITGIMVDFPAGIYHSAITASDFVFKVGNNNQPDSWAYAPAPTAISVVPGGGDGGNDRVTITWASGAIRNTWLEVQVKVTANTGLIADDVSFWGNKVADSGTPMPATSFSTTTTDSIQVLSTLGGGKPITDLRDYNRDGQVSSTDSLIAFSNLGTITRIDIPHYGPFAPLADLSKDSAAAITPDSSEE